MNSSRVNGRFPGNQSVKKLLTLTLRLLNAPALHVLQP